MKIIDTKTPVNKHELYTFLAERLNPLFSKHRQENLSFDITETTDALEIAKPSLYDGYLFSIQIHGNELHISKTEHYTDDVNVLTLEEIINNLLLDYPGRDQITGITEES